MRRIEFLKGVIITFVLLLSGCGGNQPNSQMLLEQSSSNPPLAGFSSPTEMVKTASLEDGDRCCCGAHYATDLPNQQAAAQGTQLVLSPSWDPVGQPQQDDLAFAMYAFALQGYDNPPELTMHWENPPADWACCFIGLGNQPLDRWDWFTDADISSGVLALADIAPYINHSGELVMVLLMTGTESSTLSWLRWGGNVGPSAILQANPVSGSAPLAISFDAGFSTDLDGNLADFEWDLDGDGEFNETGHEAESRGSIRSNYTYSDPGIYRPAVRVTDDDGVQDTAEREISAGGWVFVEVVEMGGSFTELAVIDGCPAICYILGGFGDCELQYVRASTATGIEASDWSEPITLDPQAAGYGVLKMLEVAGNPAISYSDSEGRPRYIRSTTDTGASVEDWSQKTTFFCSAYSCTMAIVDGNPALCWGAFHDLCYVRATTPQGASSAEWDDHFVVEYGT